jgi:DNA-binding transcriptional ArsR family regulator
MEKLLSFLKCLADENRLMILRLLMENCFCVCDLQELIGKSQSSISQHLSCFKELDLLYCKKISKRTCYSLNRKMYNKYLSELISLNCILLENFNIGISSCDIKTLNLTQGKDNKGRCFKCQNF